jgi:hypothetical protein
VLVVGKKPCRSWVKPNMLINMMLMSEKACPATPRNAQIHELSISGKNWAGVHLLLVLRFRLRVSAGERQSRVPV